MKLMVKVAVPLVVLFAVATTAVAVAAPVPSTTPFPNPPADAAVCLDEKDGIARQEINLRYAKAEYDRAVQRAGGGVGAQLDLIAKERALHVAAIALNKAKYDEAKCRNGLGNAADKACIALALEYNRLIDEAAIKVELEKLAKADYDAAVFARNLGVGDAETVDRTLRDWDLAKLDVTTVNRHVTEARKKITDNPACRSFTFERPQLAPPPRKVPPSTPQPTETPTSVTTVSPLVER